MAAEALCAGVARSELQKVRFMGRPEIDLEAFSYAKAGQPPQRSRSSSSTSVRVLRRIERGNVAPGPTPDPHRSCTTSYIRNLQENNCLVKPKSRRLEEPHYWPQGLHAVIGGPGERSQEKQSLLPTEDFRYTGYSVCNYRARSLTFGSCR